MNTFEIIFHVGTFIMLTYLFVRVIQLKRNLNYYSEIVSDIPGHIDHSHEFHGELLSIINELNRKVLELKEDERRRQSLDVERLQAYQDLHESMNKELDLFSVYMKQAESTLQNLEYIVNHDDYKHIQSQNRN